ncbi:MAG: alkaline phosphatase family protein [Candidatus Eisenbacteria bacterium]|nr:alkaline phosphatase family protein [Candidatus Eisenbacteria bacterium]
MLSRIRRSWTLSLFALCWASLIAAFVFLGLNDRFFDSARDGWTLFLMLPLILTVPAGVVAFLIGLLPPRSGDTEARRFLGLAAAVGIVPAGTLILYGALEGIFHGSSAVVLIGTILSALVLLLGAARIGVFLARRACRDGVPRTAFLILPLAALLLFPLGGARLADRPIDWDGKDRTLMLCVDGARWKLIDRFDAEDRLPTFRALQREGARFGMESFDPLMSPIIWTTIASGVLPEEHGVHNFYATANTVRAPRLWDMAQQKGKSVGVLGYLITWPPRPVDGFIIPSLFARGPETWPKELGFIRELAMSEKGNKDRDLRRYALYGVRSIQYGVRISTVLEAFRVMTHKGPYLENMIAKRFLKLRMHGDMFLELWERYQPEFAAFYNNGIDVSSHYFWKYYEPESFPGVLPEDVERYRDVIPRMYGAMDVVLGRILAKAPEGLHLVVLSDHGLRAMKTEASGALRLIRTENLLRRLGLEETVEGINLAARLHMKGKGGRGMLPPDLETILATIIEEESGEPVFSTSRKDPVSLIVRIREEVPTKGRRLRLPDGSVVPSEELIEETPARLSGEHSPDAILLLRGPHIRRGVSDGVATILDVAPTTLYMMGLPIGRNMKGRLLESAFVDGWIDNHPPTHDDYVLDAVPVSSEETDDGALKEQLRALGYLN